MFYPKIGDYVLLRNNKVAKIAQENVAGVADIFSVEILPDLRPATFPKGFIVKTLPALVDLDSLLPKDKIRLASGRVETVKGIVSYGGHYPVRVVTENSCLSYHRCGSHWNSTSSNPFNIVEIIPQVDLHTLKAGDTVKLANGETKEIKSVAYSPSEKRVEVVFTTCKTDFPWIYQRNGAIVANPSASIVKIIPKPELDFSMNAVDLTTLQPGDTVELANGKTEKVERITYGGSPGYPFQIYFSSDSPNDKRGWFYSRSGICAGIVSRGIVKTIPFVTPFTTVRGVGATAATVRSKPKLNLYTLEPGAVVTLANGNTKEVLKVDLRSRAHTNHVCITFADGVWIYNPDGTHPPVRDSAYNIVGVVKNIDASTIKPGDILTLASSMKIAVVDIVELRDSPSRFTISYANPFPTSFTVDSKGFCKIHPYSIVKITPKPKPTPLTINGHIVKSGDRLRLGNGTANTVKDVTWNEHGDNWTVACGGEFAGSLRNSSYYSSGKNPFNSEFDITAVVSNLTPPPCRWPVNPFWYLSSSQSPRQVPWPEPITTPPTKKDADPIRQVAVLDKEGDWVQEEWWAARDMLAAGEITGWAHTQAWYDASDPWD